MNFKLWSLAQYPKVLLTEAPIEPNFSAKKVCQKQHVASACLAFEEKIVYALTL